MKKTVAVTLGIAATAIVGVDVAGLGRAPLPSTNLTPQPVASPMALPRPRLRTQRHRPLIMSRYPRPHPKAKVLGPAAPHRHQVPRP